MRRLITGFGLTLALLATLGALDFARAAGPLGTFPPTRGEPQPGPDGNTAVWRAQLRVRVCNVANAGTDNKVLAALNGNNYTVMDIPVNDFEQASDRTYDLLLIGVTRLADIQYLKVSKGGSDAICLTELTLTVNERQIYARTYAQLWLDNTCFGCEYTSIPGSTLRGHSSWLGWTTLPRPRFLYPSEIGARLATAIGTGMYNFNVQSRHSMSWGAAHAAQVEDSLTMQVRMIIDFKCIDPVFGDGGCSDSSILYWADLHFTCSTAGVIVVAKIDDNAYNMSGDTGGVSGSPAEGSEIAQHVGPRLVDAFRNITVGNCAPITMYPIPSADGIDVVVEL
jgi:hypothetical protein